MRTRITAILSLLTVAFVSPTTGVAAAADSTATVTGFAAGDNDPPGGAIAYPGSAPRHGTANGTGTYDNPVTLASDPRWLSAGTRVYIPYLKKYFVMEDLCGACQSDWSGGKRRVDVWIGYYTGSSAAACESAITRSSATIVVGPASGLTVDTTPILGSSGCYL